jgi:glycosyltransferase involved in cell wall biosynthesis
MPTPKTSPKASGRTGTNSRPRVTYLITSSSVAGAQRQVHDVAVALLRRGWAPEIISMLPRDAAFSDLPALGIPFETLDMSRGVPDPRALWRLRRLLRDRRPAILHGHMVHANLLARMSRLLVRTPVVVSTMHNENEGAQWRYVLYRLTDRLTDTTTTVSQVAVQEAIRRRAVPGPDRIELVPNGLPPLGRERDDERRAATRAALGIGNEFLWLAVGRIAEEKDYPNMIAAFSRVVAGGPTVRLMIAGTGELDEQVRAQVETAGLSDQVTMLGLRRDVPDLMEAADGFVMSSAWEGLPMVLLEAGASSLPAVVTEVGGSRDAVLDGVSGLIVPIRDPGALASAMLGLMSRSESERRAMGAAARTHVLATFDLESVADRWDALYRALLDRRGTSLAGATDRNPAA